MDSAQDTLAGGLPHSEIPGSPIARISPGLFAACHVLHRLSVPRHPPDALVSRLIIAPPSPAMHTTAAHRAKPPRAKPQGPTPCLPRTERGAAISHEDTSLGHIPEQALLAPPQQAKLGFADRARNTLARACPPRSHHNSLFTLQSAPPQSPAAVSQSSPSLGRAPARQAALAAAPVVPFGGSFAGWWR